MVARIEKRSYCWRAKHRGVESNARRERSLGPMIRQVRGSRGTAVCPACGQLARNATLGLTRVVLAGGDHIFIPPIPIAVIAAAAESAVDP